MATPGAGTGMLVLDADGDGKVTNASEFVFTEWDKSATGDLDAIRNVFDTNGNGKLDSGDIRWSDFKVLIDGALVSLDSLGITSIDLSPVGSGQTFPDGSAITGTTTFTRADGSTGTVGDAILMADAAGYIIQKSFSTNTDGSQRTDIMGYQANGELAFRNVVTHGIDGNTVETKFDDDGNGIFNRTQTTIVSLGEDGSQSRIVSNFGADGGLRDRSTTVVSAERDNVTTLLDQDGDGVSDQRQVLLQHSDGSSTTVTETLSLSGAVLVRTKVDASADGLSKTTSFDLNGDGFFDRIVHETVSLNQDGSRTKTVALRSADGTAFSTELTQTGADSRAKTVAIDLDSDGDADMLTTTTISVSTDGAVTTDSLVSNADGSVRGKTSQTVSTDGYSAVSAVDFTGDGVFDLSESNVTVVDSDGGRSQVTERRSGDGALLQRTVTTTSADQKSKTFTLDTNGDGILEVVETIASGAQSTTSTSFVYGPDGTTLISKSIGVIAIDGMSRTDQTDLDGNGTVDIRTQSVTVQNGDGSVTTTETRYNGAGSVQIGRRVETISADGLAKSVSVYVGSNTAADSQATDVTVRNTDGSVTRTLTEFRGASQTFRTVNSISADRKTQIVSTFIGGYADPFQVASKVTGTDGSTIETTSLYSPDGRKLAGRDVKNVSPDGLMITISKDFNGDGATDAKTISVTALEADGSSTATVTHYNGASTGVANRIDQTISVTAANGLSRSLSVDSDGDGDLDRRIDDVTVIGADGSKTQAVSERNGSGTILISKTSRTVSANGHHLSEQVDLDGDGAVDLIRSASTSLASDGSTIEITATTGAGGVLRRQAVSATERDGRSSVVQTDLNGDGGYDEILTTAVAANGDLVRTEASYSPDGTLLVRSQQTSISADGLRIAVRADIDGNGTFDTLERSISAVNADGSVSTTNIRSNGDGTVRTGQIVTTVSADGLTETTHIYVDGDDLADLTTVKKRTLNADGTITEVLEQFGGRNNQKASRSTTTYNPDGRNTTSTTFGLTPLEAIQTRSDSFNADGTRTIIEHTSFTTDPQAYGGERKTTSISADGLSTTVKIERIGAGGSIIGDIVSSSKMLNTDGSVVDMVRQTSLAGTLIEQAVTTTSANGLEVQRVVSGQRTAASLSITTMNDDGSRTRVDTYGQSIVNGAISNVVNSKTATTSANGLREEVVTTVGNKIVRQDIDIKGTDGSKSHSTSLFNPVSGALVFAGTVTISADGLSVLRQRDSDGMGGIDYIESTVRGGDGRTTVTVSRWGDDGLLKDKVVTVTSANGLSKTNSFDTNGDGNFDRIAGDVTIINADGSKTQTISQYGEDGTTLLNRSTITTSPDGRIRTTETQLTGLGDTNETQTDVVTLDANGNEVVTSTTYYADGSKKSGYEITRYRDSDRSFTYFDYNGDGIVDEYQIDIADKAGNRQQTFGFPTGVSWRTGAADWSANGFGINESVDGREIEVIIFAPDDPANPGVFRPILGSEKIIKSAVLDGTYSWSAMNASGVVTASVVHTVDVNGVDTIQWAGVRGTSGVLLLELSQQAIFVDRMQRIYDVVFDRDMQNSEREQLATYVSAGALDSKQIANNLLAAAEFINFYGTLSNAAFLNVVYQNAYGRDASLSEVQSWLGKLNAGLVSRADLVLVVAESAEHLVVGNGHVTTNVTSGQYLHSTDKAVALDAVDRLYNVLLDRDPSAAEAAARAAAITAGTKTKYQIAAEILGSATFSTVYGTLTDSSFVSQMFENALARQPNAAELQFWTGALAGGTSRADLVVALSSDQITLAIAPKVGKAMVGTDLTDLVIGALGNDTIDGLAGDDRLFGLAGADTLIGGAGSDMMVGGTGDDTYVVDSTGDVVVENPGEGIDTVQTTLAGYTLGANVENLIYTGSAAFTGTGNGAANVITGGAGNDTLDGKAGDDTLIGGAGNDTYIVDSLGDLVIEAAGGGIDLIRTGLFSYSLAAVDNVENLTFTGMGSFTGTGNGLDNVITGGAGDDILSGGAGNDTLIGGAGADTLMGGMGDDTYIVDNIGDIVVENTGEGTDTVQTNLSSYTLGADVENLTYTGTVAFTGTGNTLSNTIIGGAAADILTGGEGDDTLDGKAGADTLIGGAGDDTYIVDNAGDVVVENADEGIDTIKTSLASYSLATRANVENLIYTGAAVFTGTGNALDNVLKGGAAADTLTGGDGNDTLDGGAGADKLIGGMGDDIYIVDNASDVVTEAANAGNDTVKTSLASLTLAANVENLIYIGTGNFAGTGNALANTIIGGNGNDTLNGGAGSDTMIGGTGNDIYIVDNAGDVVIENVGEGTDTINTGLASYALGDNIENLTYTGTVAFVGTGNALSNTIIGGAAADTLSGGDGDDTLDGKAGADTLIGGTGDDTYIVDNINDVIVENVDEGIDTIKTALASYSLASKDNVENLAYSGTASFSGTGNALNNIIVGSFNAANLLDGGGGADTLWGGFANDIYIVDDTGDVVIEETGGGTDLIKTTLSSYSLMRFSNVENLTFTGIGDFQGTGNAQKNVITGGSGNDTLDGGAGADTLIGGVGDDIYIVDNAGDVVTEGANAGIDEIRTSLSTYSLASLANVENLTYTGSGDFSGTGNAAANRIAGSTGNDTLNGGAGADTMIGGAGNDTYVIDNVGDIVIENAGEGTDTIKTSLASYGLGSDIENLTYTGSVAFTGTGNDLDNLIVGGSGPNILTGGAGNDVLVGGVAADIFVYAPGWGHDTITNFVAAGTTHDTIKMDATIFSDWATLLAASSQSGGDTIIAADASNTITLKNVALSSLQSADFQFV